MEEKLTDKDHIDFKVDILKKAIDEKCKDINLSTYDSDTIMIFAMSLCPDVNITGNDVIQIRDRLYKKLKSLN